MQSVNGKTKRVRIFDGAEESKRIRDEFLERLAKVSDGSVYTLDRICGIIGFQSDNAREFIRMCEIYPGVNVYRRWRSGRSGTWEYTFKRIDMDDAQAKVLGLAAMLRDHLAASAGLAKRISETLGVNE